MPPLTRDNETVLEIWRFCGGWNPQSLPMALAFYEVGDVDLCIGQLLLLRDLMDKRSAAK